MDKQPELVHYSYGVVKPTGKWYIRHYEVGVYTMRVEVKYGFFNLGKEFVDVDDLEDVQNCHG